MTGLETVFTLAFLIPLCAAIIRLACPIVLPALGGVYNLRAGILNLGLDGMLITGAFAGFNAAYLTGNYAIGILVGALAGGAWGVVFSLMVDFLKIEQVIAGVLINLFSYSITTYFYMLQPAQFSMPTLPDMPIPFLSEIPIIGEIFFQQMGFVYLIYILIPVFSIILFRTNVGLKIRAVGQNPQAAETMGINVRFVKYLLAILAGVMAGLGGSFLSISEFGLYSLTMSTGVGWVAITAALVGGLQPIRTFLVVLIFSTADALRLRLQAIGILEVPPQLTMMIPYILCVLVLFLSALSKSIVERRKEKQLEANIGHEYTQ